MKRLPGLLCAVGTLSLMGCGAPTGSVCPPEQTLSYASFGQPFMASYCVRCHAVDLVDRQGAPTDLNFDTVEGIRREKEEIDEEAAAGPHAVNNGMPKTAPFPSEAERRQLGEWLACGAP